VLAHLCHCPLCARATCHNLQDAFRKEAAALLSQQSRRESTANAAPTRPTSTVALEVTAFGIANHFGHLSSSLLRHQQQHCPVRRLAQICLRGPSPTRYCDGLAKESYLQRATVADQDGRSLVAPPAGTESRGANPPNCDVCSAAIAIAGYVELVACRRPNR